MENEKKILERRSVDITDSQNWCVVLRTEMEAMCAVIAAARETEKDVYDARLKEALKQFDSLEIE